MLADQCKYAFGERIHAGTTCLHSCARRAGVGWGLNRKLELRPKRHALIFGGIPSFLVIHPKRKPFSHAFGFGFGKTAVSASELCSVVLIPRSWGVLWVDRSRASRTSKKNLRAAFCPPTPGSYCLSSPANFISSFISQSGISKLAENANLSKWE